MSRYPYAEACDALRQFATESVDGIPVCSLSRSSASQMRHFIAGAIGMDDAELARKIADHARKAETA